MKRKPDMFSSDLKWRFDLESDFRSTQFERILTTLGTCFPNCASVDLLELIKMAVWIEEEIYNDATSEVDYLHILQLKIWEMETRFETTAASLGMQSQVHNRGPSQISWPNQSQARQQLLLQNIQNAIMSAGAHSSTSFPPALPSMTSLTQTSVPNAAAQRTNMQSGIAQNFVGSSVSQGLPSNIFSNTQWQMPGWNQLQQFPSQQQQLLQHQLMKQNLLQPTQWSNAVGRSTNTQSEIARAQYLFQQQQHNPQFFSSSMNSNAQTGQNAVDWQEVIYQKIQSMKKKYLRSLNEIYLQVSEEGQQLKCNVSVLNASQSERQKLLNLLKNNIQILNMSKDSIVPTMKDMHTAYETQRTISGLNCPVVHTLKDMLTAYETQVRHVINSNWRRKPVSAQQQIQQPGGHPLSTQPQQQEEEVDNQPDATHEIVDVTGPKTADSSD